MFARVAVAAAVAMSCACASRAASTELSMAVVDPAVAIQKSLAKDSMAGVSGNAKILADAATSELSPPSPEIAKAARTLQVATTLADARQAFGDLSTALVGYVDANKLALDRRFHIAYCPMANKPWLQAGTVISNPYYGTEMPTCGSIKK